MTAKVVSHNAWVDAVSDRFSHTIHKEIDFQNQHLTKNRANPSIHQNAIEDDNLWKNIYINFGLEIILFMITLNFSNCHDTKERLVFRIDAF